VSFLGLNFFDRVRSQGRKNKKLSEAPLAKSRRHNRIGRSHFALEPLEDRRMLAVLNLGVNLLADFQGTVGTTLPTDTINVGDTFFVEITAMDVGGEGTGITSLALDVAWDGDALELLHTNFDPVPMNGIITPNFPENRDGDFDGAENITNLTGAAGASGLPIGNGSPIWFSRLRFQAQAPVTASAFNVSLRPGGVTFANSDTLDTVNVDPQTITVVNETPSFSIDDVTISEGNSGTQEYTFTVSVANLGANPVSVSYATDDGFATAADNDYESTSGVLNFVPGTPPIATRSVTVIVNGDTLSEGDETFTVQLSNPSSNAEISDAQGVGTITNDDAAGPAAFSISDAQVTEGNNGQFTNITFTVTLANPPATPATVQYTFAPITAAPADDDYIPSNGTLTFTPGTLGATQQTFSIQIRGDNKVELDETFQAILQSPTNAILADGEGIGTIVNNDTAVVSVANLTFIEGNSGTSQAMIVVSMSSPAVLPVNVLLTTSNGTATEGTDYVGTTQTVTIPVDQTQVLVPITINGDTAIETDETITITIAGATFGGSADATRATIGNATATLTVSNDDVSPTAATLSIADVTIAEGDSNTSQAMVQIVLSETMSEDVTLRVNTANDTATVADGDYVAIVDQLATIPAGQTSVMVPITINGDAKVELTQSFTVALSDARIGGVSDANQIAIAGGTANVTITNDDSATISLNDVSQIEGNEDFQFTITLSNPVDVPLALTVRSLTGTPTNLFDVTIPAGATTHNFTVSVSNSDDNDIVEGERVAEIALVDLQAQGRNVSLGDVNGEAIVLDNDDATVSINDVSQEEAVGDFVFTLTLSNPVAIPVFVSVTAPEGSDIIEIPANTLMQTFTVLFDDNDIVEFDGDFPITITAVDADGLPVTIDKATGIGEILDDDFADVIISDPDISEGDNGNTIMTFTVTLTKPVDADVTLDYATSNDTAIAGVDYVAKNGTITFPRPAELTDPFITERTITIEIIGDTIGELDETFNVTLSNLTAEGLEGIAVTITDATGIGTIEDDDVTGPTLVIGDGVTVTEGDAGSTNMVFTVTLLNPPAGTVMVNYQTVDGTASSLDLDYADTFGVLTFNPGTTELTIIVPIIGDEIAELDESFTVELFTAVGATIGDDEGSGTIEDDDVISLSIANATSVTEGDDGTIAMTFEVSLSGEVDTDVTVTANTVNGTATGGTDFLALTGESLTFTAGGALTQTITVMINGDNIVELDEVLSVVLSNVSAGGRDVTLDDDGLASGTITDDDELSVSIGDATLLEGTGVTPTAFQFPITLSAAASRDVTVLVSTNAGTAEAGADFTPRTNFLVTIPAGQTTANVVIEVVADDDIETNEEFGVTITDAEIDGAADPSVTIAQANATGTITNDDAESLISIEDVTIDEGTAAGTTTMTFTITMSAVQSEEVTVTVNTSDDTATVADSDYTPRTAVQVTIPAGMTTATFAVTITRDAKVEGDEAFNVTLSNPLLDGVAAPSLVAISDGTAVGTIGNDDEATVTITAGQVAEGNTGTANLPFTITLSGPVDVPVTVTLNSTDGTATIADGDYEAVTGATVTFNPGDPLTKTFNVTVNGDTDTEPSENLTLTLSNVVASGRDVTLGTAASASGTITNDDGVTVSVADVSVAEGDTGTTTLTFTITLSQAVDAPVTVNVTTADVTTTASVDYQGLSNSPITIPAGETTATVTIDIGVDNLVELDETFTLTLSNLQTTATNVALGNAVATGTIENDDEATISIGNVTVEEPDSNTTNLVFTVTLSALVDTAITMTANTANDSATAPSDYAAISGQTVTIAANGTSATITVTINGDTTVELDEVFDLILSNLQAGGRDVTLLDGEAVGTITNDDSATIAIAPASDTEGNTGTKQLNFNITLSAAVDVPVTITLNTTDGSATAASNDYEAVSGTTFTFNPGDPLTKTFGVTINGDTVTEQNETFTLTMSNVQAAGRNVALGTTFSAQGTITNDDGPATVFVSIENASIAEGNTGTSNLAFTVRLSAAVEEDVTVTINSTNGTATAGTDFTAVSGSTFVIPAGQVTAQFNVAITGDLIVEADETFTLTLSNPLFDGVTNLARVALDTDNGDNVDNVATGTITNNDQGLLSIANVTMAEGTGSTPTAFVFTVTLSNPASSPVAFNVTTGNGTATAGTDYTAVSGQQFTIPAGQTTVQVTVNVTADSVAEANETFDVTLSNPLFGGAADTTRIALDTNNGDNVDNVATATITDDDGQSTISGVVYVDGDNDGVRDEGETGVPGAQVTLRRTDTTGTPDVVLLTGNDGTFSFANVGPGTYSIIQLQPGAFLDGLDATSTQGATAGNDTISNLVISGGAASTGNNFGERGLLPAFVSTQLYLASTPEASIVLRELNARAAELAGNTALAASIRAGASTVVNATVSISDASATEGNNGTTTMTFNVTLSNPSDAAVTVTVDTTNGTATTADNDFTAISGQTITFAAGETTKTVTVTITGDNKVEANETFNVNLSNIQANGRNVTFADASALGTINNDDNASISIADMQVLEGNSGETNLVFTLTLSNPIDVATTVEATTANGSATAGSDYTALTNQTVTFNAGATTATLTVRVTGDTTLEPNENFTVTLSNAAAANRTVTINDGSATGTITNDDGASLSIANREMVEGNSGTTNMVFTVTLANGPATGNVTVNYATMAGSATANTDYQTTTGTLTFSPGQTSQQISVPINGDTTFEQNETFTVTLSSPSSNATIATATATGTITNDDNNAQLAINDVTMVEGSSTTPTNMVFTVTLANPPATGDVTVQFATNLGAGNNATAGTDYTTTTGTLTFLQGTTSRTISVPIIGDTIAEPTETFTVTLSNSVNASISDATGTGTITNDDGAVPSLAIANVSMAEGNSGTTNMVFTVTLSNPPTSGNVTVNYGTANGTATSASDYTTTTGTLTFAPGTTTQQIMVPITGDTLVEQDETFTVTLTGAINATISGATATGTITNDDNNATLSIASQSLLEGNSGEANMVFTVTLANPPSSGDVTVQFATTADTATAGTDYDTTTGTLTFPQGTTTLQIMVPILGDTDIEGNEAFTVVLSSPTNAAIATGTATGTILNDDGPFLAIADMTIEEGDSGETNMVFTVTLNNPPSTGDVTVNYATSNDTATSGTDYAAASGTLTFAQGTTTQQIMVPVTGDTTIEPDETFIVTLSAAVNATISDAAATGTIENDDEAPAATLSITDRTLVEGDDGTTNMEFTVTLANGPSTGNVTVEYMTGGGDATATTDYTTTSGTLTFAPGTTTQTFNVPIVGDTLVENDETFNITLSNAVNATIGTETAVGTIEDDDEAPTATLSIANASRIEGDDGTANIEFTVTLANGPETGEVTVEFATSNDTATEPGDYTATSGTLTFDAGETIKTFSVPIVGDTTVEDDEVFIVTLSNPSSNATISTATATGTITDDDGAPAEATVSIADASIEEGTGAGTTTLDFIITLSAVQTQDVTITVASAPGTATVADGDYTIISQDVTILAGETTATVSSTIGRDNTVELDEEFTVTISNPRLGGSSSPSLTLGTAIATGTIENDDEATLSFEEDIEVEEANGDQTFTILMSNPVDVDVAFTFNDEISNQTITIPAGATSVTADAEVTDNTIVQFDFDYTVTISNVQATGRDVTIGEATATGTILDDDFADVVISDVTLEEGDADTTIFTFTVTLTNEVEADVTMAFATSNGTATAGEDYIAQSGVVEFLVPANPQDPLITSQTISIVVNGDTTVESDETFFVTLSELDAEGLEAEDIQAVAFENLEDTLEAIGTITNDDTTPAAPLSIVAFAPTGGGLPGEGTLLLGAGMSTVQYQDLDSNAVDSAFTAESESSLSVGLPVRRPRLTADDVFAGTADWLD
jgi:hypothetical protein